MFELLSPMALRALAFGSNPFLALGSIPKLVSEKERRLSRLTTLLLLLFSMSGGHTSSSPGPLPCQLQPDRYHCHATRVRSNKARPCPRCDLRTGTNYRAVFNTILLDGALLCHLSRHCSHISVDLLQTKIHSLPTIRSRALPASICACLRFAHT